ncbi:MAG: biopolymer transporter ExbD [Pirellulaceae bacterium]|nr:biopolymer transporter ExbD [Pirellulaceae bacterium]
MTPMIDVVFLLIIFFLVSSHLAKQENSITLALPTAASGMQDLARRDTVTINILTDGSWLLGGAPIDALTLETAIGRRMADSLQPLQLRIRTDQSVPYHRLEPILAVAARLGISDIVFSVYREGQR